jgi:hypothetical protein
LAQSIHVLLDFEEVSLPGLKRGVDASEDLFISLFPNLPGSNCEFFHEEIMLAVTFCFFDGVKEIYLTVPMDTQEVPPLVTEGALKE